VDAVDALDTIDTIDTVEECSNEAEGYLNNAEGSITPHQVITLLLDGALERIDKAIARLSDGEVDEAALLIQKTISIVNGLRDSLNFEAGGDIAVNLDALYEYIVLRLASIGKSEPLVVLDETRKLLLEVHTGWTNMPSHIQITE